MPSGDDHHRWCFVTNHARVLESIAGERTSRLRDIARTVGITERTAAQIVDDLVESSYLTKIREGRRNRYDVHEELPLRQRQHRHRTVGELIRRPRLDRFPLPQLGRARGNARQQSRRLGPRPFLQAGRVMTASLVL